MDKKEYKERLLKMNETEASFLPREEWHDRIRFLREIMAMEAIKNNEPSAYIAREEKTKPRRYNSLSTVEKNWGYKD